MLRVTDCAARTVAESRVRPGRDLCLRVQITSASAVRAVYTATFCVTAHISVVLIRQELTDKPTMNLAAQPDGAPSTRI